MEYLYTQMESVYSNRWIMCGVDLGGVRGLGERTEAARTQHTQVWGNPVFSRQSPQIQAVMSIFETLIQMAVGVKSVWGGQMCVGWTMCVMEQSVWDGQM